MTLRLRVFVAIIVGCVALAAAVAKLTLLEFAIADDYVSEVELPAKIGNVVHEMQIERGLSVGFVTAASTTDLEKKLKDQRGRVDAVTLDLATYLQREDAKARSNDVQLAIDTLLTDLVLIGDIRGSVDAKAAGIPKIVGTYTHLIEDMISVLGHLVQHSKTEVTTSRLLPFLMIVQLKEHGGLERALGSALLNQAASGNVKMDTFKRYWAKLSAENALTHEFKDVASTAYLSWKKEIVQGPVVEEVMRIRKILAEVLETGDPQGIAGSTYFGVATERLNMFKALEDRIAADYEKAATEAYDAYLTEAFWLTGFGCFALLLVGGLGFSALQVCSRGLKMIEDEIGRLTLGDLTAGDPRRTSADIDALRMRLDGLRENMQQIVSAAATLGRGDLTRPIVPMSERDEMGQALEQMRRDLTSIISDANDIVLTVAFGSSQLKDLAVDMSGGAEAQAAATEELRATVSLISESARKTTESSRDMEGVSREAATDAERSGQVVGNAIKAMSTINEQITIVQELARQTDLLALNAAVEAARAGEHGKGFAVVAAEVRKLAERSQHAAEEISALSQETSSLSSDAGALLDALVPKIQKTASMVAEISSQMMTQNDSIVEIEHAISELSDEVQKQASHSGTTADTSENLASHATELEGKLTDFKIDDELGTPQSVNDQDAEPYSAAA